MEVTELRGPEASPFLTLQLLDSKPPLSNAAENAALIASVVQRLVDVVSFRWASTVSA